MRGGEAAASTERQSGQPHEAGIERPLGFGMAERGESAILLATKLAAPSIGARLIDRTALTARLSAEPTRKLTLLSAPAGWGKTTLLAQWVGAAHPGSRFAWLSLDGSDNDPARFWTCAIAALRRTGPGVAKRAFELLKLGADLVQVVLPTLINEIAELADKTVLILDDYHLVENRAVHDQLAFFIERLPEHLRLVVATRSDPLLPLPRLRARSELLEFRSEDLRFEAVEAANLLTQVLGLDLSAAEVELLFERTEGWAAGLYLAALSIAGRPEAGAFIRTFAGDNRHVVDYLVAEVLAGQPDERRAFLLRTSILRRLNARLCDAVLESDSSAGALDEIERENLFLMPLDLSRRWYRYHQLFAELLRTELHRTEPGIVSILHRRAATWLADEGLIDDAVRHLAAADDIAGTADLIWANWVTELRSGRISTVSTWLDLLPGEIVSNDPRLGLVRAWIALDLAQLDTAADWIDKVSAASTSHMADHEAITSQLRVLCASHKFKTGDIAAALEISSRATAFELGKSAVDVTADNCVGANCVALCLHGASLYFSGRVEEAQEVFRLTVKLSGRDRRARIYALGYLALISAESGHIEDAQQLIRQVTGAGENQASLFRFVDVMASLALALLLNMTGEASAAREAADVAVASARQGGAVVEIAKALAIRAKIAGHVDEHADAPTGSEEAEEPVTPKEIELLSLLNTPMTRREIGARLYVSLNTIKSHQRRLYRKLGVTNRDAAVRRGRELGLL
jgi:LuxR family transcriptional regulator, maltose regulon positive regulatory protein